ncbi:MAG: molybdenum cofactor biosynthesis protein MoaE, partial [Candidatus Methylomirabilis sp.]
MLDITDQPIFLEPLVKAVSRSSSGAIATFLGVVREQTRGRHVLYLEY